MASKRGAPWFQEDMTGFEGENTPKYNSQELDTETNLYYYNARHYDPEVARFVTPDTVIDGEGTAAGWNRYMYVHGNPIQYKDPTGHTSSGVSGDPGLAGFVNSIAQKFGWGSNSGGGSSSGGNVGANDTTNNPVAKNSGKANDGVVKNSTSVKDLKAIIKKATGNDIELEKGFHIVMLENNTTDSYGKPAGKDKFQGKYFIINDGNIIKEGTGTSKASKTPSSESKTRAVDGIYDTAVNAGNDLLPGSYKIKGTLKEKGFNTLQLYNNKGGRVLPSTKETQNNLAIHAQAANNRWSGGIGCQILRGFQGWSENYAKTNKEINGEYHLIDMSKINK